MLTGRVPVPKSPILYSGAAKNLPLESAKVQLATSLRRWLQLYRDMDGRDEADAAERRPCRLRQFRDQSFVFLSLRYFSTGFLGLVAIRLTNGQEVTGSATRGQEVTFFLQKII